MTVNLWKKSIPSMPTEKKIFTVFIKIICKKKFDFTPDEFYLLNRKLLPFCKSEEELELRWKRLIKYHYLLQEKNKSDKQNIIPGLLKENKNQLDSHLQESLYDLYLRLLSSFGSALDSHSYYMPPQKFKSFKEDEAGLYEGIGAYLIAKERKIIIQKLIEGGPAYKSQKLQAEDIITAVAEGKKEAQSTKGMSISEVVQLIKGKKGSLVRLFILRGSKRFSVDLIRDKIEIKNESRAPKAELYSIESARDIYKVALIKIKGFYLDFTGRQNKRPDYPSTSRDLKKELLSLEKETIDALILDLRNNGGGATEEGVHVASLFLGKNSPVILTKDKHNNIKIEKSLEELVYKGPLLALSNRNTASSSEILLGALKDYERALLLGEKTYGKGTVLQLWNFADKGAFMYTRYKYFRPSGASTQLSGITPHILFPSWADFYKIGMQYLDNPQAAEKIKAIKYKNFKMVSPYLKSLEKLSATRRAKAKHFLDLLKDLEEASKKKKKEEKFSLKKEEEKKDIDIEKKEEEKKASQDKLDPYLKEALNISCDYIRLRTNKKPCSVEAIKKLK